MFGQVPQQDTAPTATPAAAANEGVSGLLPVPPGGQTPDSIRIQMKVILDAARAADAMPWPPRLVRRYTALFPYMSEWLKGGEGEQLLLEFKDEMDRLGAPVDQVAPNWRAMWGLAA